MTDILHCSAQTRSVDAKSRCVDVVASTAALDNHGTIIEQTWKLDRYLANPVILWAHNSGSTVEPPIGRASDVRVEDGALRARVSIVDAAASPLGERIWQGVQQGSIRGLSVGFMSHEQRVERRGGKDVVILSSNELYEISFVPVPSNSETLVMLRQRALANAFTHRGQVPQRKTPMTDLTLSAEDIAMARAFGRTDAQALELKREALADVARSNEELAMTNDERKLHATFPRLTVAEIREITTSANARRSR